MARRFRSSRGIGGWAILRRVVTALLPLIAIATLLMPQSVSDRARVWAGPVFMPLQNLTQGWSLDLAERFGQSDLARPAAPADDADEVRLLENALAEATGRLAQADRRLADVARLREALDGLPCRLVPARLIAPEVGGGHTPALIAKGSARGVASGGAVIRRHLDRGAREALERGEAVLTAAGLIGVVEEVGPFTSTVRLVTDPHTSFMVQVITRRGDRWRAGPEGVARGSEDGRAVSVEGIPRTSDIAPGDFIVTSPSPEAALPAYLVVGRVARCDLKPTALFYDLVVEPRVAPAEAGEVYVLSPDAGGRGGK
ncbi:MAG: rod shape-determining protein MreC [Planctomycetes bacterium]|nr:rod shape-determining protein MreC [Planctomycetota bacterium]